MFLNRDLYHTTFSEFKTITICSVHERPAAREDVQFAAVHAKSNVATAREYSDVRRKSMKIPNQIVNTSVTLPPYC